MNKTLKFGAAILAAGTLAGCGDEDFSGAYRADGAYGKQIVLNVSGDDAKIFLVGRSTAEISGLIDFEVDYKNGKLLLDSTKENIHLTFKRGADERGLDCLNCNEGKLRLPAKWALLQPEPYDVDLMLEEQEEKRQAAIKEEEQRRVEAAKLAKFDGDWVAKRHFKDDSLLIMTISPKKGVRHWAFDYSSATKQIEIDRKFAVDNDELVFPSNDSEMRYSLSADGTRLTCTNCKSENYWLKADPIEVNDLSYTRNLAGDPQATRN